MTRRRNEKETREQLIDPKLENAKWEIVRKKGVIEPGKACIETKVTGLPPHINPSGVGYVDYTMWDDDGTPLAIVEAKKSIHNEEQGRVQACLYADALEKQYGLRPIIYYTNGYTIKIIDGIYPTREVIGFHKKDELQHLIQKRKFKLTNTTPRAEICGRYYQIDAIKELISNIESKHTRSLVVLATGTGKTRISCGTSDIFLRENYVKRILFLADQKNLVLQAKEETFEKFINEPMATMIEGRYEGAEDARILFSTYQSMLARIKDTANCPFGIGHFDLIIVDEAHRSIFNKYAEIFDYFDALLLGLTATPKDEINKSTFKVFNLNTNTPNYDYGLVKAVKDGYLTYFRALDRTPDILKNGVKYSELSEEEKEEYEEKFMNEDGTLPEKIDGKVFNDYITNKDTIRKVLKQLMDEGIRVNDGNTLGKTIIFAKDHNHAIMIQEEFRKMYPELCNPTGSEGTDYCVVIDNKIKYNEILQRNFKTKQDIRIVISVDMMDTGVDIPELVNLVFFKRVASKTKFWQMIGRGTRTCENLNVISPSKEYFQRVTEDATRKTYKDKQGFLIFDVCGVFDFFNENSDGKTSKSEDELSLNQKIFLQKTELYMTMQSKYSLLNTNEKDFYVKLRNGLVEQIKTLNPNFIGVQKNMKYVEKYSDLSGWVVFLQQNYIEIKKHIAPNISGDIEMSGMLMFDYLCYKFSTNKFKNNAEFAAACKALYKIAKYLLNAKLHIPEVLAQKPILDYMQTNAFLESNICKIEEIRIAIRELMKYFEKTVLEPITTDFSDKISSTEDANDGDVDFSITIDDFKTFEEKVIFYIQTNSEKQLIKDIKELRKPNEKDIDEIYEEFLKIANDKDEFELVFKNKKDIVKFIRKNVEINSTSISEFIGQQRRKGLNDSQVDYVRALLIFIFQNGELNKQSLLSGPLDFKGYFDGAGINALLKDIENIL